jgi:hypothetical protein
MRSSLHIVFLVAAYLVASSDALALSANRVWMEFRPNGRYRVYVNYTLPARKEMRESYVEFALKKEAERFYFDLIRGADFYLPNAKDRSFETLESQAPSPW